MLGRMECSSCARCGQRMVLGHQVTYRSGDCAFNCCACIDRFGSDSEDESEIATCIRKLSLSVAQPCQTRCEPPARLSDVPPGNLSSTPIYIECNGSVETFTSICDPEHHYFIGHGAERVWPSATLLAEHLLHESQLAGKKVVELGAGCGLTGIALARRGARVTLTDLPWLLQLASYNVEANFASGEANKPAVAPLQWGCQQDAAALISQGAPDLVIGSDVVYREDELHPLFSSIEALGAPRCVLAVPDRERIMEVCRAKLLEFAWPTTTTRLHRPESATDILLITVFPTTIVEAPKKPGNNTHFVPKSRRVGKKRRGPKVCKV